MRRWIVLAALLVLGIVAVAAWMWPAGTPPVANDVPPAAEPPVATLPRDVPAAPDQPATPQTAAAPLTTLAPTVASNGHLTIRLLGRATGP